jgi:hypothetical protein
MKTVLLTILIFVFGISVPAQAPDVEWTKIYDGDDQDYGRFVQQTSDGGYIFTGDTKSFGVGLNDIWLVKTNSAGDTIWTRTYGGNEDDNSSCVRQTSDGGYIIFGETASFSPNYWKAWLIKTDENGDTSWTKLIGENRHYFIQSGQELPGGDYIFVGYTKASGAGQEDVWLVKTDAAGDTIWTKTIGGSEGDVSYSIDRTNDGGYVIAAATKSMGAGKNDCWLIRTDQSGDTIWTKTYGGVEDDYIYSVQQTEDNGFILAGGTRSFGVLNSYFNLWLVKTDFSGDTLWTRTFGGSGSEFAQAVRETSDGAYVVTGFSSSGTWIIKIDPSGDTVWTKTLGWGGGMHIESTIDGGYIILVYDYTNSTLADICLVKLGSDPTDVESPEQENIPEDYILRQNYPNPFNPSTTIKYQIPKKSEVTIKVFSLLGREVKTLINEVQEAGEYQVEFSAKGGSASGGDAAGLSSGVYFYQLKTGGMVRTKKMLLIK